jgi:hypothetical protein
MRNQGRRSTHNDETGGGSFENAQGTLAQIRNREARFSALMRRNRASSDGAIGPSRSHRCPRLIEIGAGIDSPGHPLKPVPAMNRCCANAAPVVYGHRQDSLKGRLAALGTVSGEDVATLCGFRTQGSIDAMLEILLPRRPGRKRPQRSAARAQRDRRFESKESAPHRLHFAAAGLRPSFPAAVAGSLSADGPRAPAPRRRRAGVGKSLGQGSRRTGPWARSDVRLYDPKGARQRDALRCGMVLKEPLERRAHRLSLLGR